MKVLAFAATGLIGTGLVPGAANRDHRVTALCRHPEQVPPHANVTAVRCDIFDPPALTEAAREHGRLLIPDDMRSMMHRFLLRGISPGVFGFALLLPFFTTGPANALCLQPHPVRVCTEFFHSENVLVARVVGKRQIPVTPEPENLEGWYYKLKTVQSYRGAALPNNEVYTGNDDSIFPMKVGEVYLLFINKNLEGRPAPDACGNSAAADTAGNAISEIENIAKAARTKSGNISGQVFTSIPGTEAISDIGVPGATMIAKDSAGKDQTALTDKEGRFSITVPAGHYTVAGTDASDKSEIRPFPLGYMAPTDMDIPEGGCADLIFADGPK